GNTSPDASPIILIIDTSPPTAPTIGAISGDTDAAPNRALTSDGTPTISGTGEAGREIRILLDNALFETTTVDDADTWQITLSTALTERVYSLTVQARDAAGNTSTQSTAVTLQIDTSSPSAPVIAGLDSASDSGTAGDAYTNDTSPGFTGTAEANTSLRLHNGSTLIGTATVSASGTWTS